MSRRRHIIPHVDPRFPHPRDGTAFWQASRTPKTALRDLVETAEATRPECSSSYPTW